MSIMRSNNQKSISSWYRRKFREYRKCVLLIVTVRKRRKNNSNWTPEKMKLEYEDASAMKSVVFNETESVVGHNFNGTMKTFK